MLLIVCYIRDFGIIYGGHRTNKSRFHCISQTFHLNSDGSKWKTRRRLITPTFHFRILNDFIQVFEEQAAIMVTHLEVMYTHDITYRSNHCYRYDSI